MCPSNASRLGSTLLAVAATAVVACACARSPSTPSTTTTSSAAQARASADGDDALTIRLDPPIDRTSPVDDWRARHPGAATTLDEWVARHPEAAARVASWSVEEPQQLEVLVMWAVTAPYESLSEFLFERPNWRSLREVQREDPEALASFVHWIRRARPAAEELAVRPGSLAVVARVRFVRR